MFSHSLLELWAPGRRHAKPIIAVGSSALPNSSSWTEGAVVSEAAPRDSEDERECREDPEDEAVDSVRSVSLRLMAAIVSGRMIYGKGKKFLELQ